MLRRAPQDKVYYCDFIKSGGETSDAENEWPSLLAVGNHYGVLFAGTATGFRWAHLSDLRACCVPGGEPASGAFAAVDCCAQPLVLAKT